MFYHTIISTPNLHKQLGTPNWVILDCRFDLIKPEWGFNEYQNGHIPGAIFADLNTDLSGPTHANTGRHPLPDPNEFLQRLEMWDISPETQVVAYDSVGGGFAARAWWLLRMYGHQKVSVLDGGWQKWNLEMLPISKKMEPRFPGISAWASPDHSRYVTSSQVFNILRDPAYRIIDVRAVERYRGEAEPIDPVAGHIPGAINRPTGCNLTPDGIFKPAEQLHDEIQDLLGGIPAQNTIIYCGSGVTSCHLILAMEIAGISGAKIYAGSWSEWIRDPQRPIE